ncbi:MAG TPA: energy transducer TonB [Gemmatimonadales bacterium]|nr:energy transducer TonB [Gemmatimonadales bacterium]
MRAAPFVLAGILAAGVLVAACRGKPDSTLTLPADAGAAAVRRDEPPVALNAETPVRYPPALYQQRISGTVLLQLFVDENGKVAPESTRVQESSGYPALDSAALAAAPKLQYAPALRNGVPVATLFTQPIHFRHPDRGGTTP